MAQLNEENKMRVYHARCPSYNILEDEPLLEGPAFEFVAWVDAVNLDEAFRLTNSVEEEWWLNEKVTPRRWPCRSTSVGDVIVLPDGEVYLVERVGYRWLGTWSIVYRD